MAGFEDITALNDEELLDFQSRIAQEAQQRGLVQPAGGRALIGPESAAVPYHTDNPVEFVLIGLGKMGYKIGQRAVMGGHIVTGNDLKTETAEEFGGQGNGFSYTTSLRGTITAMERPTVWMSLQSGRVAEDKIKEVAGYMIEAGRGGLIIDAANTWYYDDMKRARSLELRQRKLGIPSENRVRLIDSGTSGGVHGLRRGYSLMLGGRPHDINNLDELWRTLSPGVAVAPRTPGRVGEPDSAEWGYLRCGNNGAGHFIKMIHNAIEYGMMSSGAEGVGFIRHIQAIEADVHGTGARKELLPGTTDLNYFKGLGLIETAYTDIPEVWRRGSVISSWLMDLVAEQNLAGGQEPSRVPDSGEGRWTEMATLLAGYPAPTLATANHERFATRSGYNTSDELNKMRRGFGGHGKEPGKQS